MVLVHEKHRFLQVNPDNAIELGNGVAVQGNGAVVQGNETVVQGNETVAQWNERGNGDDGERGLTKFFCERFF
jgi:hypothetical protein